MTYDDFITTEYDLAEFIVETEWKRAGRGSCWTMGADGESESFADDAQDRFNDLSDTLDGMLRVACGDLPEGFGCEIWEIPAPRGARAKFVEMIKAEFSDIVTDEAIGRIVRL